MNEINGRQIRYMMIDGPCPLLLCLETEPHSHPICPDCGAVKFGNIFCVTCREAIKVIKVVKEIAR